MILFDEIEKAHPDVFNLMLQILDDGRLTDAKGRVVNFKNTIIVMTSNIGSAMIQDFAAQRTTGSIGYVTADREESREDQLKHRVTEELQRFFKPEFLNRVDEVIIFRALSEEQIADIVDRQLDRVVARIEKQRGVKLAIDAKAKSLLAKKGYDPAFGARPLKRVIQTQLLDPIAMILLRAGELPEGAELKVSASGDEIVIEPPKGIQFLEEAKEVVGS